MKKYKRFCTRTDWNFFQKMFIIKEGCQIGSQWQNANKFYIYENFSLRLYYRRLSRYRSQSNITDSELYY